MPALSDVRFDTLRSLGYVGAMSDMMLQWLQANGAVSPSVTDAWDEVLSIFVSGFGARNERWHEYLVTHGFDVNGKQLNDMEILFWEAGGILVPPLNTSEYGQGYGLGYS